MDVIYTDRNLNDEGCLHKYEIDLDVADKKNFEITVGIKNNVMHGGYWWYVNDTEYGGVVDSVKVITENNEIRYSGRSFRGVLMSKIIEPPNGSAYRIVSGNVGDVLQSLFRIYGLESVFVADKSGISINSYQFARYTDLYTGLLKLGASIGMNLYLSAKDGMVHVSYVPVIDYSDRIEYNQNDVNFTLTKTYKGVNHLICLGKGELQDRTVVHLYADVNGNISTSQSLYGVEEYVSTYENTSAESVEDLVSGGTERLKELIGSDAFAVTSSDTERHIGDVIGGYESVTDAYVISSITNIIVKLNDDTVDISYSVGDATRKG